MALSQIALLVAMFAVFYFIIIRPQQKRQKEALAMQSSLAKGDKIVTIGGMHGEVDSIEDGKVVIKCSDKTRLTFESNAISRVVEKGTTVVEENTN